MNRCPHPDCDRSIQTGLFACRPHWFVLPAELRRRVWAAYRSGDIEATLACYDEADAWWNR